MTATNHAITGAVIAILVPSPVAIPLAFASHFVLDAMPHFGVPERNKTFVTILAIDATIAVGILSIFILMQPEQLWVILASMIAAASPDVAWAFRWYNETKNGADPNIFHDPLTKLHSKIQWFEKPIGIIVELIWFAMMLMIIGFNL